ncbi:MAG: relaxase/mobilization nuclease domain-containing protein [Saccharofermentans sp.]|nr:relaxase/mobilization nuclease domain-containing protein [Saccharofermentans sp.]
MAITKIWALHASLRAAVNYVKNDEKTTETVIADRIAKENNFIEPDMTGKSDIEIADLNKAIGYVSQSFKTEERRLVSGINCSVENAFEQMDKVKEQQGKHGGVVGYHCVQSFLPGEIDPDLAHLIGMELAQEIWGDAGYQVVVATHIDRNHIHNHFVINSVNLEGKKDPCCYQRKISAVSDEIIKRYGLSVIAERGKKPSGLPHLSRRQLAAKIDIDQGLVICNNMTEFAEYMARKGYYVNFDDGKQYWTVQHKDWKRPMRFIRLGEEYSNSKLLYRLSHDTMLPREEGSLEDLSARQLYMYENRYQRIQAHWKDTYQYKYFMFMLKNFGINLNDYKSKREYLTREQQKNYDAIWRSIRIVSSLKEQGITNREEAVNQDLELQKGIEKLEKTQKELRQTIRITKRNPSRFNEQLEAQKQLDDTNTALEKLRKQRKVLAVILKDEPDPTPELSMNPDLTM